MLSWAGIASIEIQQAYESGDRVDVNLRLRSGLCANQQTFLWSLWNQPNEESEPTAPLHGPGDWGTYVENEELNARIAAHGPMHDDGTFCITEVTVIRWAAAK